MKQQRSDVKLPSSQGISLILTICLISGVFIYLIASKNLVFGSEPGNWTFAYFENKNLIPLWIPVTVLALVGILVLIGSKWIHKFEKTTLMTGFLLAVAIQVLLQLIYPFPMDEIVRSDGANSFLTPALQYSPTEILARFPFFTPQLPIHAKTNMPGKILFFHLLTVFTKDPQIMGYMIIAISTLGGLLLYGITNRLFHDRTVSFYSFVLYALIPSKQEFMPILNTVTPVFILLCLYLFLIYLDSKKRRFLLLLGVSLYFLVLFEPTPLVMGILFISLLAYALVQRKISPRHLIDITFFTILAFGATYLLFKVLFSFDLWKTFQHLVKDASGFNAREKRGYSIWLRENTKEFFYAVGLPVIMLLFYSAIQMIAQWKELGKGAERWSVEVFYLLGIVLSFLTVLMVGINRGEITRLWIYLAVFFQVPAALFMARSIKNNTLFFMVAATLVIQTMYSLQRVNFLL